MFIIVIIAHWVGLSRGYNAFVLRSFGGKKVKLWIRFLSIFDNN